MLDDSSYGLNFDPGKKSEHLSIGKTKKFG